MGGSAANQSTITELGRIVAVVEAAASGRTRTLVGIVGPPGAGKTHLARELTRELRSRWDVAVVAMDGFHRSNDELNRLGRTHRKGAPDTFDADGFVRLVADLAAGDTTVMAPTFSRELDEPVADAVAIDPHVPIILVEGNYLSLDDEPWQQLRDWLGVTLYVDASSAVRRARLLARHQRRFHDDEAARRWVEEVDEPNARMIEQTRGRSDHVVTIEQLPGPALW